VTRKKKKEEQGHGKTCNCKGKHSRIKKKTEMENRKGDPNERGDKKNARGHWLLVKTAVISTNVNVTKPSRKSNKKGEKVEGMNGGTQ